MGETRIKIGLLRWIGLAVMFLISGACIASQTSASFTASFSGLVYDRATHTYNSVLTLTNTGASALASPLTVAISTGNASVTVSGASNGSTYVWNVPGGSIATGKSANVTIAFSDPSSVSFTPKVVSVTGASAQDVVPNVVGATQAAATATITGAGLALGTLTTQSSTTVAAGLVISESPAAGAGVVAGSAVKLTISAGLPVDLTVMTTSTSLASDVPAVADQSITQVVSTADAQPIGTPLLIPTNSVGFSTAIFALDVNQNLILAAYANSNATTLSATSTATVLAMFTIGIIPPTGPTFAEVVQDVQSTAGFAPLVAAVNASLAEGTPPMHSSAVTQAAALVVNQSLPLIAAQTTAPAPATMAALSTLRAASVIPATQVTTMLPFQIFGPSATFPTVQSLYVSSATSDEGVYLINTMPISWDASSTDQNGATLDAGEMLGPVNPIYALFITPTAVAIAGNGEEFALLAAQTPATHEANLRQSIADVLGFLIGQLGLAPVNLSTCTQSATNNILTSLGTAFENSIINTPTGLAAAAELGGSVVGSSIFNGVREVLQCALPGSLSQSNVAKAIAGLAGFSNPATGIWKGISITVSAAGPLNETALMLYYWNANKPVGICEAGITIVNCAASFKIPSPGPLQVGASKTLLPQAFDAQGLTTPYGSYTSLFWSSTDEAVATVASGGVVTAVGPGSTNISATDRYTGATGSVVVTVTGSYPSPGSNLGPLLSFPGSQTISGCLSNVYSNGKPQTVTYQYPSLTVEYIQPPFTVQGGASYSGYYSGYSGYGFWTNVGYWPAFAPAPFFANALTVVNGQSEGTGTYNPAALTVGTYPAVVGSGIGQKETYEATISGTTLFEQWTGDLQSIGDTTVPGGVAATYTAHATWKLSSTYNIATGTQDYTLSLAQTNIYTPNSAGCLEGGEQDVTGAGSTSYNWFGSP